MRNILFASWLLFVLPLSGCVASYPKDVAIVSIKTVDYREQAELPAPPEKGSIKAIDPYRDFLFSLSDKKGNEPITSNDIEAYFRQEENDQSFKNSKQKKPILKIEFSSKENLYEFIKDKNYTLSIVPYFCNRPDSTVHLGWPYVYWRGLNISAFPLNYAIQQKNGEALTYYAFLNVVYDFTGTTSYESFDLRTDPEDVCFQLKGGSMGFGFKSNTVVLPKAEIVKALKDLPPTLQSRE